MYFSPGSSLVSTCGQRLLSPFEHKFASCAQMLGSHHYLGGRTRSEEAAQRRIFSSLALWTKQLFEGDGSPFEPQDCTLMKVSRRSHPLCPRRSKSVTSDLWRQVWPLHDAFSVKKNWQQVETAADWISCSLPGLRRPFRGVRRVMVVPCLRRPASRCRGTLRPPAFSTLLGTQLHGTPARRDIPRRPSNLTFVAVPKLKRNTSRRPPSALNVFGKFLWQLMVALEPWSTRKEDRCVCSWKRRKNCPTSEVACGSLRCTSGIRKDGQGEMGPTWTL